ncbi:MAG: hydrolase [Desulfomonile tiedjei]|uniref:Hydrolase n=1 Tax=Desulfomonile tiedjei TaxID=2358 RepID=A0A9D6V4K7_9BACT|nr:hydrolase [Desulfomonile tiedjei]
MNVKQLSAVATIVVLAAAQIAVAAEGASSKNKGASPRLLTPENSMVILIDHQPQMAFATRSIDGQLLVNNVTGLAKSAKVFKVPTLLTTVAAKSFSGPLFPTLQAVFPDRAPIDRTTMNAWEDARIRDAVKKEGRQKLVIAALWTEVCLATAVLSALDDGYEVYIVTDASGGVSTEAHNMSIQRMVQAGAVPVTWLQVLLEWQRDWARQETYDAVTGIAKEHGGAYGQGIEYAKTMLGPHASEAGSGKK